MNKYCTNVFIWLTEQNDLTIRRPANDSPFSSGGAFKPPAFLIRYAKYFSHAAGPTNLPVLRYSNKQYFPSGLNIGWFHCIRNCNSFTWPVATVTERDIRIYIVVHYWRIYHDYKLFACIGIPVEGVNIPIVFRNLFQFPLADVSFSFSHRT
jgi:hypothetical protein